MRVVSYHLLVSGLLRPVCPAGGFADGFWFFPVIVNQSQESIPRIQPENYDLDFRPIGRSRFYMPSFG